jgi:predicted DNA binding CopG/RHH family protein
MEVNTQKNTEVQKMPKNEYISYRCSVRVIEGDLTFLNKKRGSIPLCTYITEIIHKYVEQEKNKQ